MYRTDDPTRDYNRYEAEMERLDERLPVCADCGERITADYCYAINDVYICPDCLENGYRKWTEDCMDF